MFFPKLSNTTTGDGAYQFGVCAVKQSDPSVNVLTVPGAQVKVFNYTGNGEETYIYYGPSIFPPVEPNQYPPLITSNNNEDPCTFTVPVYGTLECNLL